MMTARRTGMGLAVAAAAGFLASCTPYQQQAGAVGGLAGGLAGAAFGDDHQDVVGGAAAGAALGAGAAALHEDQVRRRRNYDRYGIPPEQSNRRQPETRRPRQPQRQSSAPPPQRQSYPTAQRTDVSDEVLSPHPPHHRINVSGFQPGDLARDPKTGKIFRVP